MCNDEECNDNLGLIYEIDEEARARTTRSALSTSQEFGPNFQNLNFFAMSFICIYITHIRIVSMFACAHAAQTHFSS